VAGLFDIGRPKELDSNMKKSNIRNSNLKTDKLSLRVEIVHVLTRQELTLAIAGNCQDGSVVTQLPPALGIC